MTLIEAILKASAKAQREKYPSPPPETAILHRKRKPNKPFMYAHVGASVDSSPPAYDPRYKYRNLMKWKKQNEHLYQENMLLLIMIRNAHFTRGRVDSHWTIMPKRGHQHYQTRVDFLKRVRRDNLAMYDRLLHTEAKVPHTRILNQEWVENRKKIVKGSHAAFVLFPPVPKEIIEDVAFLPMGDVKRSRVYIKLGIKGGAVLGEICVELFDEVCPSTCHLFLDLLDGDTLGHGYVGTCFYRKVPHLYWSGGDVIYDNGFGCYAQRGRIVPIGAENFHFSHSMEGLLSMRVTVDDEMCGLFNITYKPLPQLDLRNVVFGRIIRPCKTYDIIKHLVSTLSVQPIVEIRASRRKQDGRWICGEPNTRLLNRNQARKILMSA